MNSVRKAAALAFSEKYDFTAAIVVSSNIARAFGTLCLQLSGCKTFVVSFGAFLKLAYKFASLSKTSWKVFHVISAPGTLIGSLNLENSNGGNINRLHFKYNFISYINHPGSGGHVPTFSSN